VVTSDEVAVEPQVVRIDDPDEEEEFTPLLGAVSSEKESIYPVFRDWPFAAAFWLQIMFVIYIGMTYSVQGSENFEFDWTMITQEMQKEDDITPEDVAQFQQFLSDVDDYIHVFPIRIFWYAVVPAGTLSFLLTLFWAVFIARPFSTIVVNFVLYGQVALVVLLSLAIVIASPGILSLLLALIIIAGVVYYVRLVQPMIPFASINLKVALAGINDNWITYFVVFWFSFLGYVWFAYWFYVTFGLLFYETEQCEDKNPAESIEHLENKDIYEAADCGQGLSLFLLLVSLYWTFFVILNTIQVTVAGIMATWCFDKNAASGCCSPAVWSSLYRSLTFSFGSICLGSLFQGLMTALRTLINDARSNSRSNSPGSSGCCCGLCFCLVECLARVLENVLDYFNQWAYVFVGIYGYSYIDSGRSAMELFKAKGWMSVTTERLASYVLDFTTLIVGVLTGLGSLMVERIVDSFHPESEYESFVYGPLPSWQYFAFASGFVIGCFVSSVMMSVVKGAANTLIVCWADAPVRLEANHPELAQEMIEAWSSSFPDTRVIHTTTTSEATTESGALPPQSFIV
jgi:hypothetical protein